MVKNVARTAMDVFYLSQTDRIYLIPFVSIYLSIYLSISFGALSILSLSILN